MKTSIAPSNIRSVKQSHSLKTLAITQRNSQNNLFLTALTTNQDIQYF